MEGPHEGFFVCFVVVVAEEMEDAVDDEERDFSLVGVGGFVGLPNSLGEGDDDVAEVWGFVWRCGEGFRGWVRCGFGVVALPGTGVGGGEGENVGDFVVAAIAGVQSADCVVVTEGDGQLAVAVREGGVEGGEGGPSEEVFGKW